MPWPGSNAVDVLASECERLSDVVLSLEEEDFSLPTRCPPWDVKVLLGHLWRDVDRIRVYRDAPAPPAPDTTSVTYWRSYDRVGDAPSISARSFEVAAGLLGAEPPPELGWDEIVWIETGNGRRAPSDRDRAVLGELAAAFPLLG